MLLPIRIDKRDFIFLVRPWRDARGAVPHLTEFESKLEGFNVSKLTPKGSSKIAPRAGVHVPERHEPVVDRYLIHTS